MDIIGGGGADPGGGPITPTEQPGDNPQAIAAVAAFRRAASPSPYSARPVLATRIFQPAPALQRPRMRFEQSTQRLGAIDRLDPPASLTTPWRVQQVEDVREFGRIANNEASDGREARNI